MKKLVVSMSLLMVLSLTACGGSNDPGDEALVIQEEPVRIEEDAEDDYQDPLPAEEDLGYEGEITEDNALAAIRKYVETNQPDLADMEDSGDYTIYFEVESSDENQIVVLYRSYTAAQTRYYIDRETGDVYVTELVPGIIDEETRNDETFNIRDYIDEFAEAPYGYSDDFLYEASWSTSSMVPDESGIISAEWVVEFEDMMIHYGHVVDGEFVVDHTDIIRYLEQYGEHSFRIKSETASGVQYTYKTSENDENILEYYETWDEDKYADTYSGGASLSR
jgi:hypothetical protein